MKTKSDKKEGGSWGKSKVFSLNTRKILGMTFFGSSKKRLLKFLLSQNKAKSKKVWICTVNPEFMMLGRKNKEFENLVKKSDIRVIDGIGLLWAEEVLKKREV